jgi:hypothetical protein
LYPGRHRANGQERAAQRRTQTIMPSPTVDVEQLERVLLRRGVGALEADRSTCVDCGRTPLTGEYVHLYEHPTRPGRPAIVCELCRTGRYEPPVAREIVRHCEHGHAVRLTVRVG